MKLRSALPLLAAGLGFAAAPASAELSYGVTTAGSFFSFDTATPGTQSIIGSIGLPAGQSVGGMDFRPANGQLYLMGYNATTFAGQLYTVNLGTGGLTAVGTGFTLPASTVTGTTTAAQFGFDFNPVADRIRIVRYDGQNFRLNPNDGTIAATDTNATYDASTGLTGTPRFTAAAYTNNFAGATVTTLYGYEYINDRLVTMGGLNGTPSPNGGVVFNIGVTGIVAGNTGIMDMDISQATGAAFANVFNTANQNALYSVNLATGAFTLIGSFATGAIGTASVSDIAIRAVPEPGSVALCALGGAGLLALMRRRRA